MSKLGLINNLTINFEVISPASAKILDIKEAKHFYHGASMVFIPRNFGSYTFFDPIYSNKLPSIVISLSEPARIKISGTDGPTSQILNLDPN